jgi:hypothetical protein
VGLVSAASLTTRADLVTFNVDMNGITNAAGQPAYSEVRASGAFNNWSHSVLVNNGGNVFTNTFDVGSNGEFKYTCLLSGNGSVAWEANPNRVITLTGSPQTLPLVPFRYDGIVPIDFTTNNITFQVDMTVQGVAFLNSGGMVTVSGGYNGWGNGDMLTNNPLADYPTNWWYSGTFRAVTTLVPASATPAQKLNKYKFRANFGWEEPSTRQVDGSNDRAWDATTPGDKVLPMVFYSDASLCDVLAQDTEVTMQLHVTNGTVAIDGKVFDNTVDKIYVNGESLIGAWNGWNASLPELVRNGTTDIYTNTFLVPAGRPVAQKVKYSIGGPDNEAPQYADHIQYIRTTNTSYVMPVVEFGTNYASVRVQKQYGDLAIGKPSGGTVPVTWLGCPCVTLQTRSSLTGGTWTDLPETESAGATNYPAGSPQQYFRLQKRPVP